jgi:hypothetical protein
VQIAPIESIRTKIRIFSLHQIWTELETFARGSMRGLCHKVRHKKSEIRSTWHNLELSLHLRDSLHHKFGCKVLTRRKLLCGYS